MLSYPTSEHLRGDTIETASQVVRSDRVRPSRQVGGIPLPGTRGVPATSVLRDSYSYVLHQTANFSEVLCLDIACLSAIVVEINPK